jgi:hypothetical protein
MGRGFGRRFNEQSKEIQRFAASQSTEQGAHSKQGMWMSVRPLGFYDQLADEFEVSVFGGLSREQTRRLARFVKRLLAE